MQDLKNICVRLEAQKYLESLDLPQTAIDVLLKETAFNRHVLRSQRAFEAAKNWAVTCRGLEERKIPEYLVKAQACAILLSDCFGIGGHLGVSGAGTRRHPALVNLGKGRKNAVDGPAWSAAIRAAADNYRGYFAPSEWGDLCLAYYVDHMMALLNFKLIPIEWQLTIAREGLRRSFGLDPWFPDLMDFVKADESNCVKWAQLVAYLTDELEKARQQVRGEEEVEEQPEEADST